MTQKEILARKSVVTDIMTNHKVSFSEAVAIMRDWELSGFIFFTASGETGLLKI